MLGMWWLSGLECEALGVMCWAAPWCYEEHQASDPDQNPKLITSLAQWKIHVKKYWLLVYVVTISVVVLMITEAHIFPPLGRKLSAELLLGLSLQRGSLRYLLEWVNMALTAATTAAEDSSDGYCALLTHALPCHNSVLPSSKWSASPVWSVGFSWMHFFHRCFTLHPLSVARLGVVFLFTHSITPHFTPFGHRKNLMREGRGTVQWVLQVEGTSALLVHLYWQSCSSVTNGQTWLGVGPGSWIRQFNSICLLTFPCQTSHTCPHCSHFPVLLLHVLQFPTVTIFFLHSGRDSVRIRCHC